MQLTGLHSDLPTPPAKILDAWTMLLLLLAGFGVGLVLDRMGVAAPMMFGATLASAVAHGTGLVEGSLPPPVQIAVLVMLGSTMGGRVGAISRRELLGLFPLAAGGLLVSLGVAFAFAWPAALLAGVSYADSMTAFAPGGLEAMAMLAFAMGLDTLYVGSHHLMRFLIIGFAMPFLIDRIPGRPPGRGGPAGGGGVVRAGAGRGAEASVDADRRQVLEPVLGQHELLHLRRERMRVGVVHHPA